MQIAGEVTHERGQRVYGKSLYLQLNSAVNIKLLSGLFFKKRVAAVIKRKEHLPWVSLGSGLGLSTNQLCSLGLFWTQYPYM